MVAGISEIRVGAARTINLGNFESLRIEASVTMAVGPHDNLSLLKVRAQTELRSILEETYRAQHKQKTETKSPARRESDPPAGGFKPATPEPEY